MSHGLLRDAFTEVTGRDLDESKRASIPTLNDVPHDVVEIARLMWKVSRLATAKYLRFIVKLTEEGDAEDFIEDVVLGNADPSRWRVGNYLVTLDLATPALEVSTPFLVRFEGVAGERWFRSISAGDATEREWSSPYFGPVGILRRDGRYWQKNAPGFRRVGASPGTFEQLDPSQVLVAHRRWLARRLGWWTKLYLRNPGATSEGIIAAIPDVDAARVTLDARIAADALAREARIGSPDFPRSGGFLGPDEWYR